jgi:nitrate/nitrite transporter NarK
VSGSASARARIVFAGGTFAYLCAVTQRSSLGVAGVAAAHRFGASAAALSTLGVLQLAVYALLQVPVGVLVDRYGPKRVLAVGAALMVAGQAVVAVSTSLPPAVGGRMLVGAGDATTFVAVLRIIAAWFPARRVPVMNQWLGNIGQFGQVLSAVPFAALLRLTDWTVAFLTAAGLAGVAFVVVLLVVRNGPVATAVPPPDLRTALGALRAAVRRPGTRLGFWSHFVTQSSGVVFALFWGFPFLVSAVGLDPTVAALLLSVQVVAGFLVGPTLGVLTARHPLRRSNLVLGIVTGIGIAWTAVLLWPGTPPLPLLVLLVVALGLGGPASQIGFDYARTFNPSASLGGASGVVNVGGFTASFTMMFLIGVILDAEQSLSGGPLYSLAAFRGAFSVQYLVIGTGLVLLFAARRRTRRVLLETEGVAVGPVWAAIGGQLRRRTGRR